MPEDAKASASAAGAPSQAQTYSLLVREVPRLRRYARFLTGNVDTADRLVQECLSHAILSIASRPSEVSMRAWLYVIMHGQHAGRSPDGPAGMAMEESGLELQKAFERLDREHQQVMFMVGVDGLEHEDTAAALGVSVDTIHARLLKARSVLKFEMEAPLLHGDEAKPLPESKVA